jgi:predicted short-subunit dehydrogenase-like oxidoreductase (DUF2520 family)
VTRRLRTIGRGRAGGSLDRALAAVGWEVRPGLGRGDDLAGAADGVDLVVIATPDPVVAEVAAAVTPNADAVVAHLSGSLGLGPLHGHPRPAVLHPLVALPDAERGAARLPGSWFGLAVDGDPLADEVVAALDGRAVHVAEGDWVRYHAAAVIAANHLVALMGQVERVADTIGVPLAAYLDLAAGSLDDVAELGPAAALTGPVRRGDHATVARHLDALPEDERAAYRALSEEAARLCR